MITRERAAEAALPIAVLGTTFAFSLTPRIEEYQRWHEQREQHFSGDIGVSGADSYFFVRMARLAAEGSVPETDRLRHFPSGVTPSTLPALSSVIAQVSKLGGGDIYSASLRSGSSTSESSACTCGWPASACDVQAGCSASSSFSRTRSQPLRPWRASSA
jgi:hypothetical protein